MHETLVLKASNDAVPLSPTQGKGGESEEGRTFSLPEEAHWSPPPPLPPLEFVISRGRPQAGSRRVAPTTTAVSSSAAERPLPNGDLYIGSFWGNVPHGSGKYLWADGCIYEGDWRKGKASGKGKFSWPSGATFEGEFKSGRMEGTGTFVGPEGDMYKGSWSGDRKHGYGQKKYANGDFYEGLWRHNLQDGRGRYVWRNGNEYVGEWKNGLISGRGVLVWANGNRYDGQWENGVPKGSGVFTWPDGSCYVVNWSKESQLEGSFYCGDGKELCLSENLVLAATMRKRSSVDGARNFPRICIWESDGEAGDITCDIIDNIESSFFYRDFRKGRPCCFTGGGEVKKPGRTISKGHKSYDLMLNLQLGIR